MVVRGEGSVGTPARRPIVSPAVWRAGDLTEREWCVQLGDVHRAAIVAAVAHARGAGVAEGAVDATAFPLPSIADDVRAWSDAIGSGRGFLLLRGFPVDELSDADVELAYIGLGSHLGRQVSQNSKGELLTHIRDERLPAGGPKVRLYRTRERQDFHTDAADIIGLLCLHGALRGGESRVVSSGAIYNEMLATRHDLLDELYAPLCWDRQGDHAPGEHPWFELPPIIDLDGTPRLFYVGWYIRDSQQHPEVPRLTDAQLEAMALLERLANDPSFHLQMEFRRGDVQLLNNGRVLHAREAYDDEDDPARRRHLLRLWLAAHRFTSVEAGLRGGINSPG
jgi:hypothetical protein